MEYLRQPDLDRGRRRAAARAALAVQHVHADPVQRTLPGVPGRPGDPVARRSAPTASSTASRARRTRSATASAATWCFDPRRGEQPGGDDRAVRRPLDARREPQQRMAVLHGAVQRMVQQGWASAPPRSISRRCRWSASPGTAAGSTSGSTTSASTSTSGSSDRASARRRRLPPVAPLRADRRRRATRRGARAVRVDLHARDRRRRWRRRATSWRAGWRGLLGGDARVLRQRRRRDADRRHAAAALGLRNEDIDDELAAAFGCSGWRRRLRHRQRARWARGARS